MIRRTASTTIVQRRAPDTISGQATIGRAPRRLPRGRSRPPASITLSAIVGRSGVLDGLLLKLGGRRWLQRRFLAAVEAVAEELAPPTMEASPATRRASSTPTSIPRSGERHSRGKYPAATGVSSDMAQQPSNDSGEEANRGRANGDHVGKGAPSSASAGEPARAPRRAERSAEIVGWMLCELSYVRREAQADADLAYRAWCDLPGSDGYTVYRAAQDRADAAQDELAGNHSDRV